MQFAKETIEVLKNFATINQGLIFNEGNKLRTIRGMKNIFAAATIPDSFLKKFAVYDLNELLGTLSLFTDPELEFEDECFIISEGNSTVSYFYCNPAVVIAPPDAEPALSDAVVSFELEKATLEQLIKASNVMKLKDFVIKNGELAVLNRNNVGNRYKIKVDMKSDVGNKKTFVIKVENLKLIPDDYFVQLSEQHASFVSKSGNITYFVALDI